MPRHTAYGINGGGASTGTLTLQMYFPGVVMTGNWLSGGNPAKYPAGNRFETPFDVQLTAIARRRHAAGRGRLRQAAAAAPEHPQGTDRGASRRRGAQVIISSGR